MTQRLEALVYRDRQSDAWIADVALTNSNTSWITYCASHPEALQAVEAMRDLLDRLLMDQIHASRSQRRIGHVAITPIPLEPHCYRCRHPRSEHDGLRHLALTFTTCLCCYHSDYYDPTEIHTLEASA